MFGFNWFCYSGTASYLLKKKKNLNTYYIPGTVLLSVDTTGKKKFHGINILLHEIGHKKPK